jgi:hypothetical protein
LRDGGVLTAVREAGVEGYCPKGVGITELVTAIRLVGGGQSYWQETYLLSLATAKSPTKTSSLKSQTGRVLINVRARLGRSGLRQIDRALSEANSDLEGCQQYGDKNDLTSVLNLAVTRGRRRELVTARWLVSQLLPNSPEREKGQSASSEGGDRDTSSRRDNRKEKEGDKKNAGQPLALKEESALAVRYPVRGSELQEVLFNATANRLQSSSLANLSGMPLEIDILRPAKKRELICLALEKLKEIINDLRLSSIKPTEISEKRFYILNQLWQETLTDFLGKSYKLKAIEGNIFSSDVPRQGLDSDSDVAFSERQGIEVVKLLLRDAPIVGKFILDRIPLVEEFLSYLLFQFPLIIDNVAFGPGTIEAMQRAEVLLQNLVISIANAAMQPLLNNLADVEDLKRSFYNRNLISTREIERFRNSLSWRYRWERYIGEPKAVFESNFGLLRISDRGIQKVLIYAPRRQELTKLSGLQLTVTLVLETRDAVAPGVRALVSFLGSGVVYVLTQVVGRGIGLIGRGVVQGIGNSMQDVKFGKGKK